MTDKVITQTQVQKIISRMNINVGGYRNDKKTTVVYGSASYKHPITDRLNATIKASGWKADGEWGDAEGLNNMGVEFEYKF